MRSYIRLWIFLFLLFFVCCQVSTETESPDSTTPSSLTPSAIPDDMAEVCFNNKSDYDVNVYVGITPSSGAESCTVKKHSTNTTIRLMVSKFETEFYFEYLIPVGNAIFPNFSRKVDTGHKTQRLEGGKQQTINIEIITQCKTDSAFLLLENKSGNDCYLIKGTRSVTPVGKQLTEYTLHNGQSGVYEINDRKNTQIEFSTVEDLEISMNTSKRLPLPISSVEEGMIYTMTVTADKVTLKSITPFDIDIQNQIWTRNVNSSYNVQCVRQASDKNGIVVLSTATNTPNAIICDKYDRYNKRISSESFTYAKETDTVTNIVIFDCLEIGDGVIVMLAQIGLGDGSIETYLLCYDCKNRTLPFDYRFDTEYNWKFRMNMQNSIVRVSDGKYAVVGGCVDANSSMAAFIAKIDATDKDNIIVTRKMSDVTSDVTKTEEFPNGVETMFTSVYYDGTDFYACGYENCDFKYSSNNIHKGVIYKIDSNLQTWENVYNKNKTLLFGIVGEDNHYWACGEFADNGNILKGCLVCDSTSDLLSFPAESNRYLWFNQIAVSGDKLLLCGPDAENMDGSGNACSVVMAVDKDNKTELWSNTFNNYSDALSCIPNGIGSYIVQLKNESSTVIKSADLLGR